MGDLTLNTALANYDHVLKDVYGLFAVSQNDSKKLQSHLKEYFTQMIASSGGAESIDEVQNNALLKSIVNIGAGEKTTSLLSLSAEDEPTFNGVAGSDLATPEMLRHQIVEYEKYRAPLNAGLSILEGIKALKNTQQQMKVTQKSSEVDDAVQDLNGQCKKLWEAAKDYEDMDKSALFELDQWAGTYYNDLYREDVITYAIEKPLVRDVQGEITMEENSALATGYAFNYSAPDLETTITVDGRTVQAASFDSLTLQEIEAVLNKQISIIQSDANITACRSSVMSEDYANLSPYDKMDYHHKYNLYMREAYLLWRAFAAYFVVEHRTAKPDNPDEEKDDAEEAKDDFLDRKESAIVDCLTDAYECKLRMDTVLRQMEERYRHADNIASGIASDYVSKVESINSIGSQLATCLEEAQKVREFVKTASDKNKEFKDAIGNYKAKDAFASEMSGAYEANKELIDIDGFNRFEDHLDKLHQYAMQAELYLTWLSMIIGTRDWSNPPHYKIDALNSLDAIITKFESEHPQGEEVIWSEYFYNNRTVPIGTLVSNVLSTYLSKCSRDDVKSKATDTSLQEDSFYKYLKSTFGADEEDAEKDKKTRNDLNEAAKDEMSKITDESNLPDVASGNISEVIADSTGGGEAETSVKTDGMESMDNNDNGKSYTSMLGNMSSSLGLLLAGIERALENTRDNLLVMDYAFNMFSWNTQKNEYTKEKKEGDPQTASGVAINPTNNKFYGAEVEYLIYGFDNVKNNVLAAKASIFTIRFACNTVHALTDSEINALTLAPALAIQAASLGVIPYKIPQMVMKIALAIAESAVDMVRLNNGEAVPLLKDRSTWSMSFTGAVNMAKEVTIDVGQKAIEATASATEGAVNSLVDGTVSKADNALDDMGNAVKGQAEQVAGGLFDTFANSVVQEFNNKSGQLSQEANDVAQKIVDNADAAANRYLQQSSGPVHDALQSAYDTFKNNALESIKTSIASELNRLKDSADAKVSDAVKAIKEKVTGAITGPIDSAVNDITGRLQGKVQELGDKANNIANEKINSVSSKASNRLSEEVNGFFDDNFGGYTNTSGGTSTAKGTSSGFASMLKFKYSDYLKIFMFLGLVTNSNNVVTRVGNLITANIRCAASGSDLAHACGAEFTLAKAYTYYEMKADVQLRTMFLAMPIITQKMGVEEVSAFKLSYHGALGY